MTSTKGPKLDRLEAAEYLGVTSSQIYRWARQGRLPFSKPGAFLVFDLDDLDDFLAATRHEATTGPLAEAAAE